MSLGEHLARWFGLDAPSPAVIDRLEKIERKVEKIEEVLDIDADTAAGIAQAGGDA